MTKIITLFLMILVAGCNAQPAIQNTTNDQIQTQHTKQLNGVNSQTTKQESHQRNKYGDHIGYIAPEELLAEFSAFQRQYDKYQITPSDIAQLQAITTDIEVLILMGTWCHDSKREVSRWLKITDQANNPYIKTKLYAIERSKSDPNNLASQYKLTNTPTFIIKYQSKEIGRIVEKPTQSLVEDLAEIIQTIR